MAGDDNAKTILGLGAPEEMAKPSSPDNAPNAEPILPPADSDASPTFSLGDSAAFRLGSDDSLGVDLPKGPSFPVLSAEESVNRRLQSDSVLGASSLDSLDWDLGEDDYDAPPSGFDQVMARRTPPSTEIGELADPADSLPSTSSLFGSNYRRAAANADANAHTQLLAGGRSSSSEHALPENDPVSVTPRAHATADDDALEVEFEDVVADDGGTAITQDVPSVGEDVGSGIEAGGQSGSPDATAFRARSALGGEPEAVNVPFGSVATVAARSPEPDDEEVEDLFVALETIAPIAEPEPTGAHRVPTSRSNLSGQVVLVDVKPRMQETPRMTVRYDARTPIITAPVAAARRPTPPSTRVVEPVANQENPRTIRYVLAAVVVIGLIASVLLSLR